MINRIYMYIAVGVAYSSLLHRMHIHADEVHVLGLYALSVIVWPLLALSEVVATLMGR